MKSGENLIQIASISTYIRIFYEYPTMGEKRVGTGKVQIIC